MLSLMELVGELTQSQAVFKTLKDGFALQQFWVREFETGITAQAQVNRLEQGVLIFDVSSPVWANQLRFYTPTILEKFQKHWPEILKLKFQNMPFSQQTQKPVNEIENIGPVRIEVQATDLMERLQLKSKRLRMMRLAAGWKICEACDSVFKSLQGRVCVLCAQKQQMQKNHGLMQQISEAPWARAAEGDVDSQILREKLREQTYDKIKSLFWQYQKEPSSILKKTMASLMQQHASLKTGLSPDALNDKIISEAIGKTFYQRWEKISQSAIKNK
jgi:hypothetical protein